jgi:RHS repeat-associated protein
MNDGERSYKNDSFNRVTQITNKKGQVQINRYDAEGLRYEMEENKKLVQFIFNENREVVVEKSTDKFKRLIRSYDLWASECEPEKTWYHYASDEQGSTVFITDDNKVCNKYDYDAWGNLTTFEEIIPNRYLYTGQQFDQITQQYYLRARYYNPVIARFTKEDIYRGDGLNLYTYCDNNPVIYYDLSGYAAKAICDEKCNLYRKKIDSRSMTKDEYNEYSRRMRIENKHIKDIYGQAYRHELQTGKTAQDALKTVKERNKLGSGPVVFKPPKNATEAEIEDMRKYVEGSNEALNAGYISSIGRVSTKGKLRRLASNAAKQERRRAYNQGTPYYGVVGHVPDTTWVNNPIPYKWQDEFSRVNSSAGKQATNYSIGYKPTEFILEVNGKWIF